MRYTFTLTGAVEVDDAASLADTIGLVRGVTLGVADEVDVAVELEPNVAVLALLARAVVDGLERPGLGQVELGAIDVQPA